MNAESLRLQQARDGAAPWKKWGPYLSERQWGTVREDYSASGDAWNYFSHDQARSRAYRWGEDGLAGLSDDQQQLCFALALWNENDPIVKERLFGLTNSEGNHGEDVKEYYFYLDATPTHSYLKYLYKYPQRAYPYSELVRKNAERNRSEPEYELLDTGVFDDNRYFDVFVEYAKESPEDVLIQITIWNRGPEAASLHVLPTLWFRNTWSWGNGDEKPSLQRLNTDGNGNVIAATHSELGKRFLYIDGEAALLFTENETNNERITQTANRTPHVKDSIHRYLVNGQRDAVNPQGVGTKAAVDYRLDIPAQSSRSIRLRLCDVSPDTSIAKWKRLGPFGKAFDGVFDARRREADEFYDDLFPAVLGADAKNIMRQALAGMIWSKQYYFYDVNKWLIERTESPYKLANQAPRNERWHHMHNADIISMPDKWEYPWYAAWDLAFHVTALTLVDEDFGKHQLDLMLSGAYLHPNGQLPAYEWNFGDVNPPVHAWATVFTYRLEEMRRGQGDIDWLERSFHKLLLNFTWWLNRKDRSGNNVFEGGFLGLDNIGVFDRSSPLPTGGYLEQADGTAWMALFSQNMLEIAIELALAKPAYIDMCHKFIEHYLWIASSMVKGDGNGGMWDEEHGFFYDVLRLPDGSAQRLKVRSMVGLLPLCAVTVFDGELRNKHPEITDRLHRFLESRQHLLAKIHNPSQRGYAGRLMTSILNEDRLRRVLAKMLDENEFLSPYGIRSLSRFHDEHPFVFCANGQEYKVPYVPGESDSGMFGGNSNWRGPIWIPVNTLIIRALLQYYTYYGNEFTIECPTGSGKKMNLYEVAADLGRRLSSIFLQEDGRRAVNGNIQKFQEDPHWRDLIQYFEYFHGDTAAGLGATHQTGWTGGIARIMHLFATVSAERFLEVGKSAGVVDVAEVKIARRRKSPEKRASARN